MNTKPWPILTETVLDTAALSAPLRARKPWTYTVGDVFALPPEQCAAAFGVMAATPQHRYTVEAGPGAAGWFAWYEGDSGFGASAHAALYVAREHCALVSYPDDEPAWPLPNVHLVTPPCSAQAELDERAPWALRCPAAARALRLVPTEGLTLDPWLPTPSWTVKSADGFDLVTLRGGTAPVHPDWVRSVRDQCAWAHVRFEFEGWGEWMPTFMGIDPNDGDPRSWIQGTHTFSDGRTAWKVGTKASGRLLDGVTHDGEVPTC